MAWLGCDPNSEPVGEGPETGGGSDSTTNADTSETDDATGPSSSGACLERTDASACEATPTDEGYACVWLELFPTDPETCAEGEPVGFCVENGGDPGCGVTPGCGDVEARIYALPDGSVAPFLSCGGASPPLEGEPCAADEGVCACACETTGTPACEFEPIVIDFAESGKVLPQDVVDCGSLPLGSEAQAYQETQDCILASSSGGLAYYAFIELQGIDSEVWEAYSGSPGFTFAEARWFYDNYQGGEQLWSTTCTPTPNGDPSCVPGAEIGLCLTCEGESVQVCPVG